MGPITMEKLWKKLEENESLDWLCGAVVSLVIWSFWWLFIPKIPTFGSDGTRYIKLAMGHVDEVSSPFRYRILIPLIASVFGSPGTVFKITTFVSEVIAGTFLYKYLRYFFSPAKALIGVLVFYFSFNGPYYSWYPYLTDPLNLAFIAMSFYFMIYRKNFIFTIILTFGILNRETLIFVLFPYFIYNLLYKSQSDTDIRKVFLLSIIPVALLIGVRVVIDTVFHVPESGGYFSTLLYYFKSALSRHWLNKVGGFKVIISGVLETYGIWWLFVVYGLKCADRVLKQFLVFVLPYGLMVFADTQRLLMEIFPVVVPLAVLGMSKIINSKDKIEKLVSVIVLFIIFVVQILWMLVNIGSVEVVEALKPLHLIWLFKLVSKDHRIIVIVLSGVVFFMFVRLFKIFIVHHVVALLLVAAFAFFNAVPPSFVPKYVYYSDPGCQWLAQIVRRAQAEGKSVFEVLGYDWAIYKGGQWELAELYLDKGDTMAAIKLFNKISRKLPSLAERYDFLTLLSLCKRDYKSVSKWAHYGMVFTPDVPTIPYNLGLAYMRTDHLDSAVVYFKKAIKVKEHSDGPAKFAIYYAYSNLAVIYTHLNMCDSAVYYAKKAVDSAIEDEQIRFNYIKILQHCKRYAELEEEIHKFLHDFPGCKDEARVRKIEKLLKKDMKDRK